MQYDLSFIVLYAVRPQKFKIFILPSVYFLANQFGLCNKIYFTIYVSSFHYNVYESKNLIYKNSSVHQWVFCNIKKIKFNNFTSKIKLYISFVIILIYNIYLTLQVSDNIEYTYLQSKLKNLGSYNIFSFELGSLCFYFVLIIQNNSFSVYIISFQYTQNRSQVTANLCF